MGFAAAAAGRKPARATPRRALPITTAYRMREQ